MAIAVFRGSLQLTLRQLTPPEQSQESSKKKKSRPTLSLGFHLQVHCTITMPCLQNWQHTIHSSICSNYLCKEEPGSGITSAHFRCHAVHLQIVLQTKFISMFSCFDVPKYYHFCLFSWFPYSMHTLCQVCRARLWCARDSEDFQ